MSGPARNPRDLDVRNRAFALAMRIFEISKGFPREETYSMTDQVRRSARSVTTNIAEAWYKRRYEAAFVAKLVDSLAEAGETRDWLDYALACDYIDERTYADLDAEYAGIVKTLDSMILYSGSWCRPARPQTTNDKPQTP
jgi:four helix bundle protein